MIFSYESPKSLDTLLKSRADLDGWIENLESHELHAEQVQAGEGSRKGLQNVAFRRVVEAVGHRIGARAGALVMEKNSGDARTSFVCALIGLSATFQPHDVLLGGIGSFPLLRLLQGHGEIDPCLGYRATSPWRSR